MSLTPEDREKAIQAVEARLPEGVPGSRRLWAANIVDAALAALSPAEPVGTTDPVRAALVELMSEAQAYLEPGGYPYANPAMARARAALADGPGRYS